MGEIFLLNIMNNIVSNPFLKDGNSAPPKMGYKGRDAEKQVKWVRMPKRGES